MRVKINRFLSQDLSMPLIYKCTIPEEKNWEGRISQSYLSKKHFVKKCSLGLRAPLPKSLGPQRSVSSLGQVVAGILTSECSGQRQTLQHSAISSRKFWNSSSRENLPLFSPTSTTLNQRENKNVSQEGMRICILVRRGVHPPKWIPFHHV